MPNEISFGGRSSLISVRCAITTRDHDARSNPLGSDFDYAEAFKDLDLAAVKADINVLLTDSQD